MAALEMDAFHRNVGVSRGLFGNSMNVSVVVPTLNEAANLPHVLPRIPSWIDEVVIVDGRSTDNTIEVAKNLIPNAVIVEERRPGKGAALRAGFEASHGDIIVTLDADGSADPEEMPLFVGALLAGADFVKGSRFLQGGGTKDMEWYRRLGNWGLLELVKLRFGGRFTDLCYGYNAFWRDILPLIEIGGDDGFEIETSMNVQVLRAGLSVHEVPSTEKQRIHGVSNLHSIRDGLRVLRTIIRLGLGRPHSRSDGATVDHRPSHRRAATTDLIEANAPVPGLGYRHKRILGG